MMRLHIHGRSPNPCRVVEPVTNGQGGHTGRGNLLVDQDRASSLCQGKRVSRAGDRKHHRGCKHARNEVQKARRLPLIDEFARQSACAATDVYAVCAVWRFQTSMSPFSDCGVHPPEQLARLQTLKQPLLVRGEPLRKLRSIAPTLEECCIYVQQNLAEP